MGMKYGDDEYQHYETQRWKRSAARMIARHPNSIIAQIVEETASLAERRNHDPGDEDRSER